MKQVKRLGLLGILGIAVATSVVALAGEIVTIPNAVKSESFALEVAPDAVYALGGGQSSESLRQAMQVIRMQTLQEKGYAPSDFEIQNAILKTARKFHRGNLQYAHPNAN